MIILIIICNFLIRIFTFLLYNFIHWDLLIYVMLLLPTVLLVFGIPFGITLFEIYLFYLLTIKKYNVILDDKISLPLYETIYILLIAIGENLMTILSNNPSGVFLQFEVPKDTFLFYLLIILYIANLNLYYKNNGIIHLFLMIPSILEAFFHLYNPILVSMNSRREFLTEIVFLLPFLPLTMILILLRLYIIRKNYKVLMNNSVARFYKIVIE